MNRGYLKLFRKIQDNWIWQDKPFSFGHAWIDLLLLANVKDSKFTKRGVVVEVKRGQVGMSTKGLADRWGWSRGKVDRFLKHLKNEHQIEHQKNNITTCITIINYDEYNNTDTKTNSKQTPNEHQTDTSKEVNKLRSTSLPKDFSPDGIKEWSVEKGWPVTKDIFESFCDHHVAKGSKFNDWNRALQNWVRNHYTKFNKKERKQEYNPAIHGVC